MVRQIIIVCVLLLHVMGSLAIWNGQDYEGVPKNQVAIKKCNRVVAGGSILTDNLILTAATPVFYSMEQEFSIVGGELNPYGRDVKHYEVEIITVHPMYNALSNEYDVAILKLKTKLDFTILESVKLIASLTESPKVGDPVTVSGWGLSQYKHSEENLRSSIMDVKHDLYCARILESNNKKYNNSVLFCAGSHGGDNVCYGDIGNPVMNESGEQVGIVTLDEACNYMIPAYFTRISNEQIRNWIDNVKTNQNSIRWSSDLQYYGELISQFTCT